MTGSKSTHTDDYERDVILTENGRSQAKRLGRYLNNLPDLPKPSYIFCSKTLRTAETALIVHKELHCRGQHRNKDGIKILPWSGLSRHWNTKHGSKTPHPQTEFSDIAKMAKEYECHKVKAVKLYFPDLFESKGVCAEQSLEDYRGMLWIYITKLIRQCDAKKDVEVIYLVTHEETQHSLIEILTQMPFTRARPKESGFSILDRQPSDSTQMWKWRYNPDKKKILLFSQAHLVDHQK